MGADSHRVGREGGRGGRGVAVGPKKPWMLLIARLCHMWTILPDPLSTGQAGKAWKGFGM